MKALVVGGWVRDKLLREAGYDVKSSDRDWVVVGATPQELLSLGFLPVGADFPVFLHPQTKEEYALARTERKSGHGYKGFTFYSAPDVSLESDLIRRDLTINAIAMDEDGTLVDPYGGVKDIERKVLRHVSQAFLEDPVRLLRVARFQARLPDFKIDPGTMAMLQDMVKSGEVNALVSERVGMEFRKALKEKKPSLFFIVLEKTGFLKRLYPEWTFGSKTLNLIDHIQGPKIELKRFAASFLETRPEAVRKIVGSLRLPNEYMEMATMFSTAVHVAPIESDSAKNILSALKRYDGFRRVERFQTLLSILQEAGFIKNKNFWENIVKTMADLPMAEIVSDCTDKKELPLVIERARIKKLEELLKAR